MRRLGCLGWLAAFALFWAAGVLAAKLLPLGDQPRSGPDRLYHQNAVEMRHYLNNNPIAGLLSRLLVYRISVRGMRHVPNSCEGASVSGLEGMADVVATVTDHSIFGLPIRRYQASCAGNAMGPGPADYSPRPAPRPVPDRQQVELHPPPPPPPPAPGVSPPPVPSAPLPAPR